MYTKGEEKKLRTTAASTREITANQELFS
jgi:hypothetical protein